MPAGDRYIQVPSATLFAFLESKGFVQSPPGKRSGREVVYERTHHKDPRYKVLVYTSIAVGSATVRKLGADAIRIVALFERETDSSKLGAHSDARKLKRVFRTGTVEGVLQRMYDRMREAYAKCNDAIARRVHAA